MPNAIGWFQWLSMVVLCSLLVGCTHAVVREHHTALAPSETRNTWLGGQALAEQSDPDGFALLADGKEAFSARVGLIRHAQGGVVEIITNSLESIDAAVVHGAYAPLA